MWNRDFADEVAILIDGIQNALDQMRIAALDNDRDRLAAATDRWRAYDQRMQKLFVEPPAALDLAASLRGAVESIVQSPPHAVDVDELLDSMLDRLTETLGVDTAAVLLLDPASQQLVARAAQGVEEEVHQGVRVPVGVGFAGRIAAERRPIILDRVDSTTVANPILWEKGIQAMLGVPIESEGTFLGVLHVGTLRERKFGTVDQHLLQLVSERLAPVLQSRESDSHRAAARVLQRSLLPTMLPKLAGMEFATRYVPAEEGVGGDWYDAFLLPSGSLWVMTGDLSGHGLDAAVVMGRLRSAIRAYSLHSDDPAEVLALANEKLGFFEPEHFATVLSALVRPPYESIEIASAGHLPPVMVVPGEEPYLIEMRNAPLLGATERFEAKTTNVDFPRGGVFVSYTDGLVERRGEHLAVGLERIRAAVQCDDPEVVARITMHQLVGASVPEDDIALLVMRRSI